MKYQMSIEIDAPRDRVVELFDNSECLPHWQPELVEFKPLVGVPGYEGSKTQQTYDMNGQRIVMILTVTKRQLPEELNGVYETEGVWNRVDNRFEVIGIRQTRWVLSTEFRCTGWLKVMAVLMPWMFKKQTRLAMVRFKAFVEEQG